jgi:hypothetical protein
LSIPKLFTHAAKLGHAVFSQTCEALITMVAADEEEIKACRMMQSKYGNIASSFKSDAELSIELQIQNLEPGSQQVMHALEQSFQDFKLSAVIGLFTAFEQRWGLHVDVAQAQEFVNQLPSGALRVSLSQDPSPLSASKLLSHAAKLGRTVFRDTCDVLISTVAVGEEQVRACEIMKTAYRHICASFKHTEVPVSPRSTEFIDALQKTSSQALVLDYRQLRFALQATKTAQFPESKRHPPLKLVALQRARAYGGAHPEHPISQHLPKKYRVLLEASWTAHCLIADLQELPQNPHYPAFDPQALRKAKVEHQGVIKKVAHFEAAKSHGYDTTDEIAAFMAMCPTSSAKTLQEMSALAPSHQHLVFYLGGTEKGLAALEVVVDEEGIEKALTPCISKRERSALVGFSLEFEKIFGGPSQQTFAQKIAALSMLPSTLYAPPTSAYVGLDSLLLRAARSDQEVYEAACESLIRNIPVDNNRMSTIRFVVLIASLRQNILELVSRQA